MRKFIFLDIDGVLNSQYYFQRAHDDGSLEKINYPLNHLDPVAIELLNDLISDTGAEVIISSTWRNGRTIEEIQSLLEQRGFKHKIHSKTPIFDHNQSVRGNEIKGWLKANIPFGEKVKYVIIDDDSDMLWEQRNNMVLTDNWIGMTPNTTYKARRILNDEV